MGPLLFLLYINDLKNASETLRTITFADDTNLFLSHNHLEDLHNQVNTELEKVMQWFNCNRLCLNVSKTSYQLYTKKTENYVNPQIQINNQPITREKVVKFLGVLVDEDLTFKEQIDYVSKKVSTAIGFMFRGEPILERPQLIAIYNALVLPHLSYCNIVWSINFSTHINRLFLLQKRAARVILNLSYRY